MGILDRIAGGSGPQTPQEVRSEIDKLNRKVALIDEYISKTVEPTLNAHDDTIFGLEKLSKANDVASQRANAKADVAINSIPEIVDQRIQEWLNTGFKVSVDRWFEEAEVGPKMDQWYDRKDIGPSVGKAIELPEGTIPKDVGEIVGILDRVGRRISSVPELQLVAPVVKTVTGTTTELGVGTMTPGIPKMGTISKAMEIEDRLSKLMSTWYPTLVSLQAGWDKVFLPNVQAVANWKESWTDAARFVLDNRGGIRSLLDGSTAVFDNRISKIVDNKLSVFNAQILAKTGFTGDAMQFITDMTTPQSYLGNKKPRDFILDTIKFYHDNFSGIQTVRDMFAANRSALFTEIDLWQASVSGGERLRGHIIDFWSSAEVSGGLRGFSIKDKIDDWWNIEEIVDGVKTRAKSAVESTDAWQKLEGAKEKLKEIAPHGEMFRSLKERLGNMRDCVEKVRTGLKGRLDVTDVLISNVKDRKMKWDATWTDVGWAAMFGVAGVAFAASKKAFDSFWDQQNEMYRHLIDIVEKQNAMIKNLHDNLECLRDQLGQASEVIGSKLDQISKL